MESQTPTKQSKLLFCCCVKLEPLAYFIHIFNFVGWTTFVGLYFLFVADEYGWIDGMMHNEGGYWYDYFLKMVFFLFLIAVVQNWLSLAFVRVMLKYAKCLFIYLTMMYLLNITAILIYAVTKMVRFEGSWFDVSMALRDRLFIYGVWVGIMMHLGQSFFKVKNAEEHERIMEAVSELYKRK